jgi:hypothetical protein
VRQRIEKYSIIRPTDKETLFFETWESQRCLPKWKYILLNGILKEGLILFTIFKILQYIFLSEAFRLFYTSLNGILFLFFEILFWFLGGYVVGWFKYNSNEIEYELIKGIKE